MPRRGNRTTHGQRKIWFPCEIGDNEPSVECSKKQKTTAETTPLSELDINVVRAEVGCLDEMGGGQSMNRDAWGRLFGDCRRPGVQDPKDLEGQLGRDIMNSEKLEGGEDGLELEGDNDCTANDITGVNNNKKNKSSLIPSMVGY